MPLRDGIPGSGETPLHLRLNHDQSKAKSEVWVLDLRRKKKCGEERPICQHCSFSKYPCTWPSDGDLVDRRHRSYRKIPRADTSGPREPFQDAPIDSTTAVGLRKSPFLFSPATHTVTFPGVQYELLHHYLNYFLPKLLSSTWNKSHFVEYQGQITDLIMNSQSVRYAVLASCAANKFTLVGDLQYHHLSLSFYSRAVTDANVALDEMCSKELTPSDALLVTVIYLYLHDLNGRDSLADPATHIAGAMALINLRLDRDSTSMSTSRAIDRVALESVMYQAISLSMRKPFAPCFFDSGRFISRAERLLAATASPSSSPILMFPPPLYHLIRNIIGLYNSPTRDHGTMVHIASELERWETFAVHQDIEVPASQPKDHYYDCLQSLYALAVSIVYNWVLGTIPLPLTTQFSNLPNPPGNGPPTVGTSPWQIQSALIILMQPEFSELWTQSYLATWPTFIFGLAVGSPKQAFSIRDTMIRISERAGYGPAHGILLELENEWREKWDFTNCSK